MATKRKGTKMSLNDFLVDQSTGSWADEMEDLPSAPAGAYSGGADHEVGHNRGFGDRSRGGFGRSYSRDSRYDGRDSPRDSRFASRPERTPQPLPTTPPYTAHLGNLPFDLNENDIEEFFHESRITNIRILRDREERPKGFGYVEFEDLESLKKALDLSGESLRNRPIRISVAEPREREDRTAGEWRRPTPRESSSPSPRNDRFGDRYGHREDRWGGDRGESKEPRDQSTRGDRSPRGERGDRSPRGDRPDRGAFREQGDRNRTDTEWRGGAFSNRTNIRERRSEERLASTNTSPPPPIRKRLELKPRSSSVTTATTPLSDSPTSTPRPSKPNPFGEARPIDTDEAQRRVEERRKEREEKAKKEFAEKESLEKASEPQGIATQENGDS